MWRSVGKWLVSAFLWTCLALPVHGQKEGQLRPLAEVVTVDPGPTCLQEDRLERRIARWLEREQLPSDLAIHVVGGPGASQARFILQRGSAEPTVRQLAEVPGECGDLHSALGLAIALAVDTEQLQALPDSEGEGESGSGLSDRDRLPWSVGASLAVGAGFGVLNSGSMAGIAAFHLAPVPNLEIRLSGFGTYAGQVSLADTKILYSAGVLALDIGVCPRVKSASFQVLACFSLVGGAMRTAGVQGLEPSDTQIQPYWAAGAGLEFRLGFSDEVGLRAGVQVLLPLMDRVVSALDDNSAAVVSDAFPKAGLLPILGILWLPGGGMR